MIKTNSSQFFLACLLILLASWPCFCFGSLVAVLVASLIIDLAINDAVLMTLEVVISLSR